MELPYFVTGETNEEELRVWTSLGCSRAYNIVQWQQIHKAMELIKKQKQEEKKHSEVKEEDEPIAEVSEEKEIAQGEL